MMYPIYVDALRSSLFSIAEVTFVVANRKSATYNVKGKQNVVEKKSAAKPHTAVEHEEAITVNRRESREPPAGADAARTAPRWLSNAGAWNAG